MDSISIGFGEDFVTNFAGWWNSWSVDYALSIDPKNVNWTEADKFLDGIEDNSIDNVLVSGHGVSGRFATFDFGSITGPSSQERMFLDKLRKKLRDDSLIEIRACTVAKGTVGQAFILELAKITGADVRAYDDWYAVVPHGNEYTVDSAGNVEVTHQYPPYKDSIFNPNRSTCKADKPDKPKPKCEDPVKEKPDVEKKVP